METRPSTPEIIWDWGTAYDFFVSLLVLHHPDRFGLRGSWARGVRSRLPVEPRTFFEETQGLMKVPLKFLYGLPQPKDSSFMLEALAAVPPKERIETLTLTAETPPETTAVLREVAERGSWTEADRQVIWEKVSHKTPELYSAMEEEIKRSLDWWSRPETFGEQALQALQAYFEVFFAEEEDRIRPKLEQALLRAQTLADRLPLPDLLEELSQGIRFGEGLERPSLVLAPSFWVSPLIIISQLDAQHDILLFGGRPEDASLVPGDMVPDGLFQPLKALADPTRLRILRYLAEEPLTPTELARRLRLRAPTVIHHLNTLRLAGLVHLTFERKGDRRYAARMSRVRSMCSQLNAFLGREEPS